MEALAEGFLFGSLDKVAQTDGRTNFLILGLGGPKNEPSGLTDTILFLSFDHSRGRHLLLSIPRDIWVSSMQAKLNSAYYYGNRNDGLGMEWTKRFVEEIVGQPIHYTTVISFEGFVEMVDLFGGVSVNVERGFTDEKYPITGREDDVCGGDPNLSCRWEKISFSRGLQTLNGSTALKFVRSRHSEGEEGSDFARSARQQKMILGVREKLLSPWFFLNPIKVDNMLQLVTRHIETNLPQASTGIFGRALLYVKSENIRSEVLDGVYQKNDKPSFLLNPPVSKEYGNQWVLVPRTGDWEEVHEWVRCLLTEDQCTIAQAPVAVPTPTPARSIKINN